MENRRCPVCLANGHDTGPDRGHLYLMKEGDRWCCNRVKNHPNSQFVLIDADPDTKLPMFEPNTSTLNGTTTGSTIQSNFDNSEDINSYPCVDFRGIPANIYEAYGCKMELSQSDRSVVAVYYPMHEEGGQVAWKCRVVKTKKFFKVAYNNKNRGTDV